MAPKNLVSINDYKDGSVAVCPHCSTTTTFTIGIAWPSNNPHGKAITSISQIERGGGASQKEALKHFYLRIWKCTACDEPTVIAYPPNRKANESLRIWPVGSGRVIDRPDLVPQNVLKDFREATSIEILSPMASATLARRCLQSIITKHFADKMPRSNKLKQQVDAVLKANVLSSHIADELHGIRSIGNNSAHTNVDPDTNQIIDIEEGEASACLDVIESLIDFCYVTPAKAAERKKKREQKHGSDER